MHISLLIQPPQHNKPQNRSCDRTNILSGRSNYPSAAASTPPDQQPPTPGVYNEKSKADWPLFITRSIRRTTRASSSYCSCCGGVIKKVLAQNFLSDARRRREICGAGQIFCSSGLLILRAPRAAGDSSLKTGPSTILCACVVAAEPSSGKLL
jgi:hypothetical protein